LEAIQNAPPKEILLFKMGLNETLYGPVYCDESSIKACIAFDGMMRRDLCIDFNHNTEQPPTHQSPETQQAAGWFSLRSDERGLWASAPKYMRDYLGEGIYWTPYGKDKIMGGGYRYDSPSALVEDRGDGNFYVKAITSCALTNKPAKIGFEPILFGAPKMEKLILFCQQLFGVTTEDDLIKALGTQTAEIRTQKIEQILLEHKDRFQPEERESLFKIGALDHELLKANLAARKVNFTAPAATAPVVQPLRAVSPIVPQPPARPAGKPFAEMNYKERHLAANGDPALYEELIKTATK
jgi:hypothetical protein